MSFYIDTEGNWDQQIPEIPDFIPLEPKKSKPKRKQRKRQQSVEWNDYLENAEGLEEYISNVQSMNLQDDSDVDITEEGIFDLLMEQEDELEYDSDLNILNGIELNSGSGSGSDSDSEYDEQLRKTLQDSDASESEYLRREFNQENAWNISTEEYETKSKERIFEMQVNGVYQIEKSKTQQRKLKKQEKRNSKKIKKLAIEKREQESGELYDILRAQNNKRIGGDLIKYLSKINVNMQEFVKDRSLPEYMMLPSMPGGIRRLVGYMAKLYHILPKTHGKGNKKTTLLYRTKLSMIPQNWKSIPSQVAASEQKIPGPVGKHRGGPASKQSIKKGIVDTKPRVGDIVGASAKPIGEANVGHKMMRLMGWSPGETLGSTGDAVAEPIQVTIRAKRMGLGGK